MSATAKALREQLTPIALQLKANRSIVRPVSQVVVRLKAVSGEDRYAKTVDEILRWMNRRAGVKLPAEAWDRRSFDLSDVGSQRTAAVLIPEPKYWAARLDDACKVVPMRTWVTEIGVGALEDGDQLFGVRLMCVSRGSDEPFDRSVPGFVRQILSHGPSELDGHPVRLSPRLVSTQDEVIDLVRFLEDPNRLSEVVVISLPENSQDISDAAISATSLQEKLLGVAHVYVLTGRASYWLTEHVGRELSVFRSAIRTYRPGFIAWLAEPSHHPVVLAQRIMLWHEKGPAAFTIWLANAVLFSSVRNSDREMRVPSFNGARQAAARFERTQIEEAGGSDAELMALYKEDNEKLRSELKEQKEIHDGLLAAADGERQAAVEDAALARSQSLQRAHRVRVLEDRLSKVSATPEINVLPDTLDGFEDWCAENLSGSVELVNRAYQGVRKSDFHDPTLIYQALILLRDFYVPMRIEGTPERREAYLSALASLQLEDSLTGDGTKYDSDTYSVAYGGAKRLLDRHLKGSNSRDRRFGFRIYFFWDEEGQVVVVGWLPSHLQNRLS